MTRTGQGTPIVLIHGLGGSSDWWRRNIEVLAESHSVAAVDLVGFGRNRFFLRRSHLPLVFEEVAALLTRWIESEFDEPVHLVGNSMGGHIAMHVAAARPDLIRSLTLVDSTGIPFHLDPRAHLENIVVPRGMLSFATVLARDLFRAGPTSLAVAFARLVLDDARPLMRVLRMPVLLIWGESDPLVPLAYAEEMRQHIPQARLTVIRRAGHIPMWENASAFNTELLEFISEVEHAERLSAPTRGDPTPAGHAPFAWGLAGWHDGIAHRQAGRARDVVLVHGLGMSSSYLVRVAEALHSRGWNPIAPDLRGFGDSENAPAMSPAEHAAALVRWADAMNIRDAVWIGHSTGCNVVAHLGASRADLAQRTIFIGPLWTSHAHPTVRAFPRLLLDAVREPLALYPYVLRAYWRSGLARWARTWLRNAHDSGAPQLPRASVAMAGVHDPIPDRAAMTRLGIPWIDLPGAHAALFSYPEETAAAICAATVTPAPAPASREGSSATDW